MPKPILAHWLQSLYYFNILLYQLKISYMAKFRTSYQCASCGATTLQWKGQCPSCGEWNTLTQTTMKPAKTGALTGPLTSLKNIGQSFKEPILSGINALDGILGNGLVPGSAILIGGEPGIGKSTLLLQVAMAVAMQGKRVLYASGEEALPQIRARGERLGTLPDTLFALSTSRVEELIPILENAATQPDVLVLDSIQTFTSDIAEGLPGNVSQVRAVATALLEICRARDITLVMIGHVTKDGTLAGPRLLEHMVDTVVSLEGDRRQMFRLLRVFKNRFGPSEDLLVFQMAHNGLQIVDDPSTFFLGSRNDSLSGTAVVMAIDGRRPLAVEVQALVNRSFLSIPRRTALGFDINRLHLLLAVMEKRLKLNFAQMDIYAKVGGGIKLTDPGLDIALCAAILSSYYDKPLPGKCILWGEIDLNGQIRPVSGDAQRLKQASKLGYEPIIKPSTSLLSDLNSIHELQKRLFAKK